VERRGAAEPWKRETFETQQRKLSRCSSKHLLAGATEAPAEGERGGGVREGGGGGGHADLMGRLRP